MNKLLEEMETKLGISPEMSRMETPQMRLARILHCVVLGYTYTVPAPETSNAEGREEGTTT